MELFTHCSLVRLFGIVQNSFLKQKKEDGGGRKKKREEDLSQKRSRR
jgi:hypothetical protein